MTSRPRRGSSRPVSYTHLNIGNAIIIAREKGFVTFSDVMESINKYFDFPWVGACGYNTGSNKARALLYDTTTVSYTHLERKSHETDNHAK